MDRDLLEFDQLGVPGAVLDDEGETANQRFQRLYLQACLTPIHPLITHYIPSNGYIPIIYSPHGNILTAITLSLPLILSPPLPPSLPLFSGDGR